MGRVKACTVPSLIIWRLVNPSIWNIQVSTLLWGKLACHTSVEEGPRWSYDRVNNQLSCTTRRVNQGLYAKLGQDTWCVNANDSSNYPDIDEQTRFSRILHWNWSKCPEGSIFKVTWNDELWPDQRAGCVIHIPWLRGHIHVCSLWCGVRCHISIDCLPNWCG